MAAARFALPLKLLMAMCLAVLHAVCLCQAASATPGDATRTASADHDCCHDAAEASPGGEAPDAHHPGCRHCDGSTLLPSTDVSAPAVSYVALAATVPPARIEWAAARPPVPTQVVTPPSSLSHHPPLSVPEQTGILLV